MVGVDGLAADGLVAAAGELSHRGLPENHGTGVAERFRDESVVGRHRVPEDGRSVGRRHVDGVDVVLEQDGDAVQRPARPSAPALGIEGGGRLEGPRIHRDDRVELGAAVLVGSYPCEVRCHHLLRRQEATPYGVGDARERRFFEAELSCTPNGKVPGSMRPATATESDEDRNARRLMMESIRSKGGRQGWPGLNFRKAAIHTGVRKDNEL